MTSNQTRISSDVWERAAAVAESMGLANERQAIEAVFRRFADAYTQGLQVNLAPATKAIAPITSPDTENMTASDALDSLWDEDAA